MVMEKLWEINEVMEDMQRVSLDNVKNTIYVRSFCTDHNHVANMDQPYNSFGIIL